MGGYVIVPRSFFDHDLWLESRRLSRAEAWMDLIQAAAWADHTVRLRGETCFVKRGQVIHSTRTLAKRWKWSNSSVSRFLNALQNRERRIERHEERGQNIITVLNYGTYQDPEFYVRNADRNDPRNSGWNGAGTALEQTEEEKEEKETSSSPEKTVDQGVDGLGESRVHDDEELGDLKEIWNQVTTEVIGSPLTWRDDHGRPLLATVAGLNVAEIRDTMTAFLNNPGIKYKMLRTLASGDVFQNHRPRRSGNVIPFEDVSPLRGVCGCGEVVLGPKPTGGSPMTMINLSCGGCGTLVTCRKEG